MKYPIRSSHRDRTIANRTLVPHEVLLKPCQVVLCVPRYQLRVRVLREGRSIGSQRLLRWVDSRIGL